MTDTPTEVIQSPKAFRPIQFNPNRLLNDCMAAIQRAERGDTPTITLAVPYSLEDERWKKKNKLRIDPDDKTSPLGVVVRNDNIAQMLYPGHIVARFDAYEFSRWLIVTTDRGKAAKPGEEITNVRVSSNG